MISRDMSDFNSLFLSDQDRKNFKMAELLECIQLIREEAQEYGEDNELAGFILSTLRDYNLNEV